VGRLLLSVSLSFLVGSICNSPCRNTFWLACGSVWNQRDIVRHQVEPKLFCLFCLKQWSDEKVVAGQLPSNGDYVIDSIRTT
jgi:hypothetical protein